MHRLRASVAAVLVALGLIAAAPAAANREWLPCNLRTPGGGGVLLPESEILWGVTKARREKRHPVQVEVRHAVADFDRFEGADVDPVRVRALGLGFAARLAPRWTLSALVPHYDVRTATGDFSGVGDTTLDLHWRVTAEKREDERMMRDRWWELSFGGTLPTGDEDDDLGYGSATGRVGVSWNAGKSRDGKWVAPKWLARIGVQYGHHFENSDISSLRTHAQVQGSLGRRWGSRFLYAFGLATDWELSDDVERLPGLVRDDRHQTDALASVGFTAARDRIQVLLGCLVALDDDGLRDEVIPTLSALVRFGHD